MNTFDTMQNVRILNILDPVVRATDLSNTVVDKKSLEEIIHLIAVGTAGITLDGSNYIDVFLEDGDASDLSDAAVVTNANSITGSMDSLSTGRLIRLNAMTLDNAIYKVAYKGPKRYSRLRLDFVGTHATGTPIAVMAIQAAPRYVGRNQFSDAGSANALP